MHACTTVCMNLQLAFKEAVAGSADSLGLLPRVGSSVASFSSVAERQP